MKLNSLTKVLMVNFVSFLCNLLHIYIVNQISFEVKKNLTFPQGLIINLLYDFKHQSSKHPKSSHS